MFEGVISSLLVKILAAVTGVAAIGGGLAAAGVLPGLGDQAPTAETSVSSSAGNAAVSTSPALPVDLSDLPAGSEAAEAVALIDQAQASAGAATAAANQCLADADSQISSLVTAISSITNPTQAQALVVRARAIGTDAQECAGEATALSQTAMDQASAASEIASGLGGLPGLGGLSGLSDPRESLAGILAATEIATQAAAAAQTLALGIVNQVIATVSGLLPLPGGEGGLPLPVPGIGEGGLPLPVPGIGEGGLPLPVPGIGEGGLPLPVPGTGEGGLPLPGLDGAGEPNQLVTDLAGSILGALGGTLPIPAL